MSQDIIQFATDAPRKEPWIRIGSGFSTKSKKGINVVFGNKIPKEKGSDEMIETVKKLTFQPNDQLLIQEATDMDGKVVIAKNGATVYRVLLKPRDDKPVESK